MEKVLLVTFSDNADHQDILFGIFEQEHPTHDIWLMITKKPKVPFNNSPRIKLVSCPSRPGICKGTFHFGELLYIIRWVKKQHFDCILFESLHVWNLPVMIFCHKNCKTFQMIHDLIPHPGDKAEKYVYLMNKVVCKLADIIVLPNWRFREKATELYKISQERIKCIDLWRRFPDYTPPRFTGRVLFFGRINPYKGVEFLQEIIARCPEISFDIVGQPDPEIKEKLFQIERLPNVLLNCGYVTNKEMSKSFMQADWVILPYQSATQSGVIIDAYRYSRPVIAFDVGAIAEQIEEGISGFLIPAGDCEAFSKRLKELVDLPRSMYEKLTRSCYEFGVQKYSAKGAVSRFDQMLHL